MLKPDATSNAATGPISNTETPILAYSMERSTVLGFIITFIRSHKKLIATAAVMVILPTIWFHSPSLRGSVAAHIDVEHGRYEIQTFGLPAPWSPQYSRLLYTRYGVRSRAVAGCMVDSTQVSYVEAYDSVVADAAMRRFGHDIFAECAADAEKVYAKEMTARVAAAQAP
jgi:hypothetical protein